MQANQLEKFTWRGIRRTWGKEIISVSPPLVLPFDRTESFGPLMESTSLELKVQSVNTPSYATKKKYGFLPENPYSRSKLTQSKGYATSTNYGSVGWMGAYENEEVIFPTARWSMASEFPSPDTTEVVSEILKRIKGTTWNSPVAAIEARKTADMVSSAVEKFIYANRALRKGDLAAFFSIFGLTFSRADDRRRQARFRHAYGRRPDDAASNALLEYYYGWIPLLMDIHDACKTLADRLHSPRMDTTTVSVKRNQSVFSRGVDPVELSPLTNVRWEMESTFQIRMKVRFACDYAASAASAVGISNPLYALYEITPWSFVADWIVPVGDFLSSIDATVGKTFHSGILAISAKHQYDAEFLSRDGFNKGCRGLDQRTLVKKERSVMTSFPPIVFPNVDAHASIRRMTASIALLQQQVARRRPKPTG